MSDRTVIVTGASSGIDAATARALHAAGAAETNAAAGRAVGSGAGAVAARPGLLGRLGGPARVTVVPAPAGSGKTVLLRSWISQPGLSGARRGCRSGAMSGIRSTFG